jgi:hypothetical protein
VWYYSYMKLTKRQVKALKTIMHYNTQECSHYFKTNKADRKYHVWHSLRLLYKIVYGKRELDTLEAVYKGSKS